MISSSLFTIASTIGLSVSKRLKGTWNTKWDKITVEQARDKRLRPNQFWHGITLIDPITNRKISDAEEAYEYLNKTGMVIKRGAHRPDIGSHQQKSKTPDMGTYLTKSINEARWYSYPFVALVDIPYGKLRQLKIDEDILGAAATESLYLTHRPTPMLLEFQKLAKRAFIRMASQDVDRPIPGSFMNNTMGDVLRNMETGNTNAYINDYASIGRFMNSVGLTEPEKELISIWTNMGELDINNFFMPTSEMSEIPISELYFLQK